MLKCNKKILKRLKQKKKGFTLLEIVVALAIIGIMMIPLGGALLTSVKANKMGEIKQESKLISQEIIEKLRSLGNVQETGTEPLMVGKNQSDTIEIKKDDVDEKIYNVKGSVIDSEGMTMIEGTIKEQGELKEDYGSLEYLKKDFDIFVWVKNNEIIVLSDADVPVAGDKGRNIDTYIKAYENNRAIGKKDNINKNLKLEIKTVGAKEVVVFNKINETDDEALATITTTTSDIKKIGVYVESQRNNDELNNELINLHLDNKNNQEVEIYFFNNKFHPIGHDESTDPITDSFKSNRYINGNFDIYDNIKYYKESEKLNKGLYTIALEFRKKIPNGTTVTEKTQSEFMVDN